MVRLLVAVCLALSALCVHQWRTLARLQAERAAAEVEALETGVADRRDEIVRAMAWFDAYLRSAADTERPTGLCDGGQPDLELAGHWILDAYVRARAGGASEAEARRRVARAYGEAARTAR